LYDLLQDSSKKDKPGGDTKMHKTTKFLLTIIKVAQKRKKKIIFFSLSPWSSGLEAFGHFFRNHAGEPPR
jgi:hypothetical protein